MATAPQALRPSSNTWDQGRPGTRYQLVKEGGNAAFLQRAGYQFYRAPVAPVVADEYVVGDVVDGHVYRPIGNGATVTTTPFGQQTA